MAKRDDIPKTDPSEIEALIQRLKQCEPSVGWRQFPYRRAESSPYSLSSGESCRAWLNVFLLQNGVGTGFTSADAILP